MAKKTTFLAKSGGNGPGIEAIRPREVLDAEIRGIQTMVAAVDATLTRDECETCGYRPTPALLRERANLSRAASTVSAELRQRDKHELEQDFQMGADELDALIVEYLRERPSEVRELVKESLSEMESGDHLLSH